MNQQLQLILVQAGSYSIASLLVLISIAFLLRGFFWKYLKVRMSMGRLILIKSRSLIRDHFIVGWVEEGMLCFKDPLDKKRKEPIKLPISEENQCIYRSLGISWIDHDERTNAVMSHKYEAQSVDVRKYSDLMVRCLQNLALMDKTWLVIIMVCLVTLIIAGVSVYFGYQNHVDIMATKTMMTGLADKIHGQVVASSGVV